MYGGFQMYGGCMNIGGIWTPTKSDNTPKIGKDRITDKVGLILICMFYFLISKNRAPPCCDRYEYGLFTAACTLVVRVCVCSSLQLPKYIIKHMA